MESLSDADWLIDDFGRLLDIDLDREDFFEQMDCLDKDKPVAIYCRGGRRSKIAAERFVGKGFEVTELDGGIITWEGEIEK